MALHFPRCSSHCWLAIESCWITRPLRSSPLSRGVNANTGRSARVPRIGTLRLVRTTHLAFSLSIVATRSHVPHKSPIHARAAFIPGAMWPGNRSSATLILEPLQFSSFDIRLIPFRYFISSSLSLIFMHHTCRSQAPTFPQRSPPRLLTFAA